jgi:hypothetical protein
VSASTMQDRPLWCGSCDKRTRLLLIPGETPADDRVVRCELCSPVDGRDSCGKHIQPPGRQCTLCAYDIPGRGEIEPHPAPEGLL